MQAQQGQSGSKARDKNLTMEIIEKFASKLCGKRPDLKEENRECYENWKKKIHDVSLDFILLI